MSNGAPEPFEDKQGRPLGVLARIALAYLLICVAGGVGAFFVDLPFVSRESLVPLVLAGVLFLAAVAFLARSTGGRGR